MEIKTTPRALELLTGEVATEHDMRDMISGLVESRGSQSAVAKELGISNAYLHDMLHGSRGVSGKAVMALGGWERVVVFRRKQDCIEIEKGGLTQNGNR